MFAARGAVCLLLAAGSLAAACPSSTTPTPQAGPDSQSSATETVTVRDPQLEQRVARLDLRLLEREAQLEDLQAKLDDARHEVVRALAKLQSLASRAEAASALAESEVALQSLKTAAGQATPEITQATQLLELATAEFNKQNYGGALYLANQAKSMVAVGRERVPVGARGSLRAGEVLFALPLRLQAVSRANVREGPGASYAVVFTADAGAPLVGYSYVDQWVRVSDEAGHSGWMFQTLVGRRQEGGR